MSKYFFPLFLLLLVIFPTLTVEAADASSGVSKNAQKNDASLIKLAVDQYSETLAKETLDSWVVSKNSFSLSSNIKAEFENTDYCPINNFFCELTLTVSERQRLHLSRQTNINIDLIRSYVEDLARKVDRDPSDAKFKVENGKVITFMESQNGITLDVEKSVETIFSALESNKELSNQTITLPFESKKPNLDYADVNNLGVSSLLGEGTSNFVGSPKNRIYNIKVATERFNGVLIKPDEEFSFVKILGEVDAEHGYLPELVIKQGVTEPEFGGGICQVSTTTFRAAIYSGLEITARKNHAYPVSYYNPQGMDSTVYVPRPDLRFKNNTPGYILIQTKIEGTKLTFSFYGTDDGRKTTVDGPKILEKQPDGAMKTTFTQHVFDKNGTEFITDTFNSSYNSPYKYPHPGGPVLTTKPANWSKDEWKDYQKQQKDIAKAAAEAAKKH